MTTTDSAEVRNAVSRTSRGRDVSEDSWVGMQWCNTNWGDLLQPAPLSLSLLGSLMVTASGASDFSLISENSTIVGFKYAKYPTSFKTCLQQMVGDGYTAFETFSYQMTRINNGSSQLPGTIKEAMVVSLQSASSIEIECMLPAELDSVLELTKICRDASLTCETAFTGIRALAQEILECTIHKVGTGQQVRQQNELYLATLQRRKVEEEKIAEEAKQSVVLMEKSFANAEKEFRAVADGLQFGWGSVGTGTIENFTNSITVPMNAHCGMPRGQSDHLPNGSPPVPKKNTQYSGQASSDQGVTLAQQVLEFLSAVKRLISGGSGPKPDSDKVSVSSKKDGRSGAETRLEVTENFLDNARRISSEFRHTATITEHVNATTAPMGRQDDSTLNKDDPVVNGMNQTMQGIEAQCKLILQQNRHVATGNILTTASSAHAAVEAKLKVDQTRADFEAARESYDKGHARLMGTQHAIRRMTGEMEQLELQNATLEKAIPVLTQAIEAFTTLDAQFSQMAKFFCNIASLISDVIKPEVPSLAKNIEANKPDLTGVSPSDWTRYAMDGQMIGLLKASMHAERRSRTYLTMLTSYIMPAQREVGHMLHFQEDMSEEGRRQFTSKLSRAQRELQHVAQRASDEIARLVARDQQEFTRSLNEYWKMASNTVRPALPAIDEPVPPEIITVTEAHIAQD